MRLGWETCGIMMSMIEGLTRSGSTREEIEGERQALISFFPSRVIVKGRREICSQIGQIASTYTG